MTRDTALFEKGAAFSNGALWRRIRKPELASRIREIYGEICAHLKPGGAFLNADLINAPTAALHPRYDGVAAARHRREGASAEDLAAMARHGRRSPATASRGPSRLPWINTQRR
jgi:hypothetical protein